MCNQLCNQLHKYIRQVPGGKICFTGAVENICCILKPAVISTVIAALLTNELKATLSLMIKTILTVLFVVFLLSVKQTSFGQQRKLDSLFAKGDTTAVMDSLMMGSSSTARMRVILLMRKWANHI